MKKILALLLALALCAGLSAPALAAGFPDVPPGHYAASAIDACVAKGIASGYADGTFRPGAPVTRAQFCVMFTRAVYPEELQRYNTAENQAAGWFVPAAAALYYDAPYGGVLSETSFEEDYRSASAMNQLINQYDMAQMLANFSFYNFVIWYDDPRNDAAKSKISDWSSIPPIYQNAVATCYTLGVLGGQSDGTFGGSKTMNRGQACAVIDRMANILNKGTTAQPASRLSLSSPASPSSRLSPPSTPASFPRFAALSAIT